MTQTIINKVIAVPNSSAWMVVKCRLPLCKWSKDWGDDTCRQMCLVNPNFYLNSPAQGLDDCSTVEMYTSPDMQTHPSQ